MRIVLTKHRTYTDLTCIRADGSYTKEKLGPSFPAHDMAHYVVEKTLKMEKGFFGHIEDGYSIEDLSAKDIIVQLGFEAMLAEIVTRNLQSLASGSSNVEDFNDLIQLEMQLHEEPFDIVPEETIKEMMQEYKSLLKKWEELSDGDSIELKF